MHTDAQLSVIKAWIEALAAGDLEHAVNPLHDGSDTDAILLGLAQIQAQLGATRGSLSAFERHSADIARAHAELERRQARLHAIAFNDGLTGVANRKRIEDHLAETLGSATARETGVAVFLLDLDRFKPVNDALGHAAGDAVLCEVARRMEALVGERGLVGRLGGDEFAIVLDDADCPEVAAQLAADLVDAVSAPIVWNGEIIRVSASVGVALSQRGEAAAGELMREADQAMYTVKRRGRCGHAVRRAAPTGPQRSDREAVIRRRRARTSLMRFATTRQLAPVRAA